eukprot:CAMPEP_0177163916 /NCGR_PEP_ID=MMETSP0367-20130122/6662_1 /TAXON_ID=447022 ORGANISM="Scrippsiella hangoei-like, Strain SHHI-4" /NCGR_SAMPLE_ID=MMETSP0367 /ASSEMBLY_ACC=CAM_ASM_000362 /LENGTH=176 /DNA_ID=CAMNT_0018609763 /DNA_START=81 /DNA_END=607 /DNA_ORIENTATION=-
MTPPDAVSEGGLDEQLAKKKFPVGDECWDGDFAWGKCCVKEHAADCWDQVFTYDRCCRGLPPLPTRWVAEPRASAKARCLGAVAGRAMDAGARPEACANGRYYYMAYLHGIFLEEDGLLEPQALVAADSHREHASWTLPGADPARPTARVHVRWGPLRARGVREGGRGRVAGAPCG